MFRLELGALHSRPPRLDFAHPANHISTTLTDCATVAVNLYPRSRRRPMRLTLSVSDRGTTEQCRRMHDEMRKRGDW